MDISGRRTREPTVRSLALDELMRSPQPDTTMGARRSLADRVRLEQILSERNLPSTNTRYNPAGYQPASANSSVSQSKKLRLDSQGRERERRKVSNRENFVDTGLREPVSLMSIDDDVYDYDSGSESSVHYLNEEDPLPARRELSPHNRGRDARHRLSSQRTVDTVIPTVPRTQSRDVPPLHDVSFSSRGSRATGSQGDIYSPPPSSRSEKMQRTLKSISLNEREPFPSVRARIAQQLERENKEKSRSRDREDKVVGRSRSPLQNGNSNNNALSDTDTENTLDKRSHAEEEAVILNSSPESVIVRPVKRKVATAPDIHSAATSNRGQRKVASGVTSKRRGENVPPSRSKSAETKPRTSSAARWVDKTPGKSRAVSLSTERPAAEHKKVETIRPDSWRKGMAVVKRELKQKGISDKPASSSRPTSARSDKSDGSRHSDVARLQNSDAEHQDVVDSQPVKDKPIRSKKRVKVKVLEAEPIEPVSKQRHYDTTTVQEFMAKKRREKRLQDLELKKKQQQAESERKDKLKALQERSRAVASARGSRSSTSKPPSGVSKGRPTSNNTYTAVPPTSQRTSDETGVWAPPAASSMSYTVVQPNFSQDNGQVDQDADVSRGSKHNDSVSSEGEGDTTLTEAELIPEATTPNKQSSSRGGSRGGTPRSKSDSPLSSRNKAVEEEIQQLVQEARLRNQAAQQAQAQQTPIKLLTQLTSTPSLTTSADTETSEPAVQPTRAKSTRIANLALTTAQLMTKMDMIKADLLENSAMSRSNSRPASSTNWFDTSRSPRGGGALSAPLTRQQRLTNSHLFTHHFPADELPGNNKAWMSESTTSLSEDEVTDKEEDHTHSTVTESGTHSTVTTDSELSENESELSSLDLRIREALSRPSNFTVSSRTQATRQNQQDIIKPVARVARSLAFDAAKQGDGHSVINTYLRKLKAEREALTRPPTSTTRQAPATTDTFMTTTSMSTMTTQTLSSRLSTAIQTDTPAEETTQQAHPATTHTAYLSPHRAPGVSVAQVPVSATAVTSQARQSYMSVSDTRVTQAPVSSEDRPSTVQAFMTGTSSATVSSANDRPAYQSQSDYRVTASQARSMPPPPVYTTRTQATLASQQPRISPAGLDLAMSAGLSLLDGMNQQQAQLSDVERTRFSTLAQQETVALAQILKGNKERQEQQLMNLRQKIKQDEQESHQKLAELKRDAELANQKRLEAEAANQRMEKAEHQDQKEANKISREATRKLLEAQNESTKAFTEAARMLAERRERLSEPVTEPPVSRSVVDSLRAQTDTVTQSLTALVDQQREQNLEILRLARLGPPTSAGAAAGDTDSDQSPKQPQRKHTRSPRPKSRTRSPREHKTSPRSGSGEGKSSPRQRKHTKSPKDRHFKDIIEKSDMSTTSSRQSDDTIQESVVSYSDDFGSASDKSLTTTSPTKSPTKTRDRSPSGRGDESHSHSTVTESIAESIKQSDDSVKTASDIESLASPVKDESLVQTDISMSGSPTRSSIHTRVSGSISTNMSATESKQHRSASSVKTVSAAAGDRGDSFATSKTRHSTADTVTSGSSSNGDSPLHKVVLGAVKEVFKDGSPAQLQSDPTFYDKLKSVLYTLKDGAAPPTALSTPSKQGSPSKPPMVAPLSPRIDRKLTMRRPGGQRSNKRSSFPADSESDESHSLLAEEVREAARKVEQARKKLRKETASDTDQECQLSALQHQLDEAKRRHAMMKKARQKYEFQKKQDAYKKQIEYYEEDMVRMKKEMDDLASMHSHAANSSAATSASLSVAIRPQIKQPRAPSSSGSDNGSRQRHSSGASDAELPTPQISVIQKPLVGKTLTSQLSSTRPPTSYERQRSDSGGAKSVDSVSDHREKTPDGYADDFESEISKATPRQLPQVRSPTDKHKPSTAATAETSPLFGDQGIRRRRQSSASTASDSIAESIAESLAEEIVSPHSSKRSDSLLSHGDEGDLLNLSEPSPTKTSPQAKPAAVVNEEPSLLDLNKDDLPVFDAKPAVEDDIKPRSRTDSDASSRTITEAKSDSRSATPTWSRTHSRSRSRSSSKSRSRSPTSRTASRTSRSRSRSRSYTSRSRSRSVTRSRSRSASKTISEASIISEVFSEKVPSVASAVGDVDSEGEQPLLQLDLTGATTPDVPSVGADVSGGVGATPAGEITHDEKKDEEKPTELFTPTETKTPDVQPEKSIAEEEELFDSYRSDFSSVHSDRSISEKSDQSLSGKSDQSLSGKSDQSVSMKSDQSVHEKSEHEKAEVDKSEGRKESGLDKSGDSDTVKSEVIEASIASEKTNGFESDFESDGSLLSLGIESPRPEAQAAKHDKSPAREKSPDLMSIQSSAKKESPIQSPERQKSPDVLSSQSPARKQSPVQTSIREISPDKSVDQSQAKEKILDQSDSAESVADESIVDDLLESAYQENLTQQQEPLLSLKDELAAALADNDLSLTREDDEEEDEKVSPRQPDDKQEVGGEIVKDEQMAQSTPRPSEGSEFGDTKSQRDFDELERLVTENASYSSSANSSSSRISLGSKSPDLMPDISHKSDPGKPEGKQDKPGDTGEDNSPRSVDSASTIEEESELDKVIRSAASAVESFAEDIVLDELNQSQGDVGLSIMEETTPRSLMSLESSGADELDAGLDDDVPTPRAESPVSDQGREDITQTHIAETLTAVAESKSEDYIITTRVDDEVTGSAKSAEVTEQPASVKAKVQQHDESAVEAVCADIISDSLTSAMSMWREKRAELAQQNAPTVTETQDVRSSPDKQEVKKDVESDREDKENEKPAKSEEKELPVSPPSSSSSSSLLGALPPLAIGSPTKSTSLSATSGATALSPSPKSPDSTSSDESSSPQRSPTKSLFPSFVEEARHEQWAQLDKEIDSVFGANEGDWFDEDYGLTVDSKSGASGVIPTKEILSRVVVPEPVFVVPHKEQEVHAVADAALDVFWQARRCGESWDSLVPSPTYLDTGSMLELEANSNTAFRHFVFDLIRDMLMDIYQNEDDGEAPANQASAPLGRGPLNRHYKHRQPPTTLDQVREIIHRHIYPAVTGKLVHPTKSARVTSVVRNKRRDKVDTILTQELKEEELSWLNYAQDEESVKQALVEDVFKVLIEDSVSAITGAYNRRTQLLKQQTTEL